MTHDAARVNPDSSRADGRSRVRFTKGQMCPVCGGSESDRRGDGQRCHGYIEGDWIHCSREEYAGNARPDRSGTTWSHKAEGSCPCGKEHAPARGLPSRSNRGTIDCVYDYRDRAGKVVYQTVRFKNPKDFRQRRPVGRGRYAWNLSGVDVVLYNLPALFVADPAEIVWIVEGEKDADRLGSLGLLATTSPMGAGKWHLVDSSPLGGRPCVAIADNDDSGRKHVQGVAADLYGKAASVKTLELPGLPEHGDVSDWLDHGATVDQLRALAAAAPAWSPGSSARPLPSTNGSSNGNGRLLRLPDGSINYRVLTAAELNIQAASAITIRPIKWLWPYRLAEKEMALVAGEGGLGKSQVILLIAATISNGSAWPDRSGIAPEGTVLIVSAEDSPETTIVPRLRALGADLSKVQIITAPKLMVKEEDQKPLIRMQWLEDLGYWGQVCDLYPDLKLLIMDPVVSYLGKGINDQKNDQVRSVIEPFLDEIIKRRGICFLANTHLSKSLEAKSIIHRITGSIAYVNIPRNVHVVFRHPDDPETRVLAQCKCNNAPDDLPALKFRIEAQRVMSESGEIETSRPVFSDELVSPHDLKRIMAVHKGRPGPEPVKLADLARWVLGKLEGKGPVSQFELIEDAREDGHLPPVTASNPKPTKSPLYRAVERFSEFFPGWTVVDTTKGPRKAWELIKSTDERPVSQGVPF
jgi:putative DNA primase/helicase